MNILIIGGTRFVGRHLIEAAVERGHQVTIFHRGKHTSAGLPSIDEILGDRNHDLDLLTNKNWDAVIDTCGYLPQHVQASAQALKESTAQYIFISSISAYAGFSKPGFDEDAPLAELSAEQQAVFDEIDPLGEFDGYALGELYGALKVLCEKAVTKTYEHNSLIIRPGLIVGTYDWTDRFTYWVMRVAEGGKVLSPGDFESYVQFIDGGDLANWTIRMIESNETGIFNATGKPFATTFGGMLETIKSVLRSNAEFVWVDDEFMAENNIAPWTEMPVYLPETDETKGFSAASVDRAVSKGLVFSDLRETVIKTYEWRKRDDAGLIAGISRERESELLDLWREQKQRF